MMDNLDDYLAIHLSKKCNLKCRHCYQSMYTSQTVLLSDVEKAIVIFNPKWIVFYGGEPMIEQDAILKIINKHPEKKFLVYTNGTIWNDKIFDKLDKIVVTIESFFYEEAIKYRPLSEKQHRTSINLVLKYKDKAEILHNIYPTYHDKTFYRIAKILDIKVQSYPIIMNTSVFHYMDSIKESNIFHEMPPNRFPKMRLLEDGTLTRDMRGIYNLCNVNDWDEKYRTQPLPISSKCLSCSYLNKCPASSIFPHFVYDIININNDPHFCKMTKEYYEKNKKYIL